MKDQWIQKAIKHEWWLRKQLWISPDKTIPKKLLEDLAWAEIWTSVSWHSVTPLLKKRATLAKTLIWMKK